MLAISARDILICTNYRGLLSKRNNPKILTISSAIAKFEKVRGWNNDVCTCFVSKVIMRHDSYFVGS